MLPGACFRLEFLVFNIRGMCYGLEEHMQFFIVSMVNVALLYEKCADGIVSPGFNGSRRIARGGGVEKVRSGGSRVHRSARVPGWKPGEIRTSETRWNHCCLRSQIR